MYTVLMNQTGTGSEISTITAKNPSYLCLSSDGKHLYATDENEVGGAVGCLCI